MNALAHCFGQSRERERKPGEHPNQEPWHVEPKRLSMMVEVSAEPLQVVLDEKDTEELRHAQLYRNIPRQRDCKKQREAQPPQAAHQDLPVAPQGGVDTDNKQ